MENSQKEDTQNSAGKTKSGKTKFSNHQLRKRVPSTKFPKRENDIYVNNSTNLQCQVNKCHKLFQEGYSEAFIHGLGAAVSTAVNVALILQDKLSNTVDLAVNTSTVNLIDDYSPLRDTEQPFSRVRTNSAIHIRVYRKPNF